MKGAKRKHPYDVIFESSSKRFKAVYCGQTTLETSTLPAFCIFKRSNVLVNSSTFWNIHFFCDVTISELGKKELSCISYIEGDRKIEINICSNFEVRSLGPNFQPRMTQTRVFMYQW